MYLGDFAENATVVVYFTTNDAAGGAVAPSTAFETADFKIYKAGSETPKASVNGLTVTSPHNSIAGLHGLVIDMSVDTDDAGWWVTDTDYTLVLSPSDETVDSQTVVAVLATWGCANRIANIIEIEGIDATDQIADAVWGEAQADNDTPGTMGHSMKRAAGKRYG